jgi:CDP-glucose 4,6-dehydratase
MTLHHLGADVYGCSPEPTVRPNIYLETDLNELIKSYIGDLRNFDYMNNLVSEINPEIVIHISPTNGYYNEIEPKELYSTNLLGTLNMLEVCKQNENVKVFMNLVPGYSPNLNLPDTNGKNAGELELIRGSFLSTEFLTSGYRNAYFNEKDDKIRKYIFNVSTCQTVGGGDWSKLNIMREFFYVAGIYSKTIVINDGYQVKLLHILDVISGILQIIKNYLEKDGGVNDYNLIPDDNYLVRESEIAQTFSSLWGEGAKFLLAKHSVSLNESKIRIPVNNYPVYPVWKPQLTVHEAIDLCIQWEKARNRGANMQKFTLKQIQFFLG